MPSRTFFRLPTDKQDKIITAAEQLLVDKSIAEVTITDIVNAASIPRGSFYQYFQDKADVYLYILRSLNHDLKQSFLTLLDDHEGDLFEAMRAMFTWALVQLTQSERSQILQNLFLNLDFRDYQKLEPPHPHQLVSSWGQDIKDHADLHALAITDDQVDLLLQIFFALLGHMLAHFITQRDVQKDARQAYVQRFNLIIDWLEYGVLAQKGRKEHD